MTKQKKRAAHGTLYMSQMAENLIKDIQDLVDAHGPTVHFELEQEQWSDGYEVCVYSYRDETDDEYESRIRGERLAQLNKEAHEKALLESLKKKYGE